MYTYVLLQDDGKFIKSISDTEQAGSIKILVPLNWQRKFFEYPTKFWLDENKTLQGDPGSLPQDDLEDLKSTVQDQETTISNLKSTVQNINISSLQDTVNTLQKDVQSQPDDSDLKKQVSALGSAIVTIQKQQAAAQQQTAQSSSNGQQNK